VQYIPPTKATGDVLDHDRRFERRTQYRRAVVFE